MEEAVLIFRASVSCRAGDWAAWAGGWVGWAAVGVGVGGSSSASSASAMLSCDAVGVVHSELSWFESVRFSSRSVVSES